MAKKPTEATAGSKAAAPNQAAKKEPRLRQEHAKAVTALAFSPDGQLLASGSADTTARLWEADTEASVGILTGCPWGVRSVAFTPAGKSVVVLSQGVRGDVKGRTHVYVWDLLTRQRDKIDLGKFPGVRAALRPDGRVLALRDKDMIRLVDLASGDEVGDLPEGVYGDALAFTADGSRLVTGFHTGELRFWDSGKRKPVQALNGHKNWISCLALSPKGRFLASAGSSRCEEWHLLPPDLTIRVWDVQAGKELKCFSGGWKETAYLTFLPGGKQMVSLHDPGAEGQVCLWSTSSAKPLASWAPRGGVQAVAVSPDGKRLAVGDPRGGLRVWELGKVLT